MIWNQFLKKDTRLSTGLKVLRKKISDLQNLSSTVEIEMSRHSSVMDNKIQRMEYLLKKSKEVCTQMEKNIAILKTLKKQEAGQLEPSAMSSKPTVSETKSEKPKQQTNVQAIHLKMVKEKPTDRPKPAYFGESPFVKLGFVESHKPKSEERHPPDPPL